MEAMFSETPSNFYEVESAVITELPQIVSIFYSSSQVFFYDACSFQRHSNLPSHSKVYLFRYFKEHNSSIFITRGILMELSSNLYLKETSIQFIKALKTEGIPVIILYEEDIFHILSECFSEIKRVNEYLIWTLRAMNKGTSVIKTLLSANPELSASCIEGKQKKKSDLYERFFIELRKTKEKDDNLGETLLAVCLDVLSKLPGMSDGKLCVITEDKMAAITINEISTNTNKNFQGAKLIILSTTKLVQFMFHEGLNLPREEMTTFLSHNMNGNISVLALTKYDMKSREISFESVDELVDRMREANEIRVVF